MGEKKEKKMKSSGSRMEKAKSPGLPKEKKNIQTNAYNIENQK